MMKKILLTAAALCTLAACNEKIVVDQNETGAGFISIGLNPDNSIQVRSVSDEELDSYIVTIGENTVSYSELKGIPYSVQPGTYAVSAQNCTADEAVSANGGYGQKHIYGEAGPVEVASGVTVPVTVRCSVVNAAASVVFSDSFKAAFENYSVVLDADSRNISVNDDNARAEFYWNLDENGTFALEYSVSADVRGTGDTKTASGVIRLSKAVKSILNFTAGEDGYLGIEVVADDSMTEKDENITVDPYRG